ncbi:hypothetical protein D3C85_775120 [compost metagenome]
MSIDPRFMDEQLGIDRSEVAKRYQRLAQEAVNAESVNETPMETAGPPKRRQIAYSTSSSEASVQESTFDREAAQPMVQKSFTPQPPPRREHSYQDEPEDDRPQRIMQGGDTQAWPGGPLQSEILAWKKQFGRIYKTNTPDGDSFVWRALNRFEYKQIMSTPNTNELLREEMIAETCVLFPYNYCYEDMVNQAGGIPSMLAEQIMQKSAFTRKVTVETL